MKIILSSLLFLIPATSFSQIVKKVKLIELATKKPIKEQYVSILKNNDLWVSIGATDPKGNCKFEIWNYDSSSSYQVDINAKGYKQLRQSIDLLNKKTLNITLVPDSIYFPQFPNMIYEDCSGFGFGDYFPYEPSKLDDIPKTIQEKVISHIKAKVGAEFYSKLKFSGGQVVNLDRLYLVYPKAKDFKWTPYSYYLCFSFSDFEKGIAKYTAKIVLDSNGNVIEDIQLPNIKAIPNKSNIISIYKATEIAKFYNFQAGIENIKLYYDKELDSFVWCFSKIVNDNGLTFGIETIVINAITGNKIEIRYGGGIR